MLELLRRVAQIPSLIALHVNVPTRAYVVIEDDHRWSPTPECDSVPHGDHARLPWSGLERRLIAKARQIGNAALNGIGAVNLDRQARYGVSPFCVAGEQLLLCSLDVNLHVVGWTVPLDECR